MTLNVGRGLYRLWFVFACLWVIISMLFAFASFEYGKRYVWMHDKNIVSETTKYTMDNYTDIMKQYEIDYFSKPIIYVGTYVEEGKFAEALVSASSLVMAKERGRALFAFLQWSLWAFIPPAVILAIGSAFYWALLGFRPRG